MKFVFGIPLYYPTAEMLRQIALLAESFTVILYDNTGSDAEYSSRISKDVSLYLYNGKNDGLSIAYNKMLELSSLIGADYLCLLDQDSIFTKQSIMKMIEFIEDESSDDTAVYAPRISYGGYEKTYGKRFKAVPFSISSGSFISLSLADKYKLSFDQNYFIDRVDADFCKKIELNKLKIIRYINSVLTQRLGEENCTGLFTHTKIRHYYIFRNRLYYNNKFYGGKAAFVKSLLQSLKHILIIITRENDKLVKLHYCRMGLWDYRNGAMGEYGGWKSLS